MKLTLGIKLIKYKYKCKLTYTHTPHTHTHTIGGTKKKRFDSYVPDAKKSII